MEVIKDIASLAVIILAGCALAVSIWWAVDEKRLSKKFWEKMERDEDEFYKELKDEMAELDKEEASRKKKLKDEVES